MKSLLIFGEHDGNTLKQIERVSKSSEYTVLMADGHLGNAHPVGGVTSYINKVSLHAVGVDISCGNKAVKTNILYSEIKDDLLKIVNQIGRDISFGVGQNNGMWEVDHELFDDPTWDMNIIKDFKQSARKQLGTVGGGNHYVDVLVDQNDYIWVGVHFGSRGLGHKIATHFMKLAGGIDSMDAEPVILDLETSLGSDYYAAMKLAGRYAYAGRDWVCDHIVNNILKGQTLDSVHNNHNYAWEEEHFGNKRIVCRKGSTPIFPNQRGFIGGSMGDCAVIVKGIECEATRNTLYSTVHGAGRVMSRTEAKGKYNRKTGQLLKEGKISKNDMHEWLNRFGVILRGGEVDEAPQAYRRLSEVLEHHKDTIEIQEILKPVGVLMAGRGVHDPYKD